MPARRSLLRLIPLLLFALVAANCASRTPRAPAEYVPPSLDLARYSTLGIVEFGGRGAKGLGEPATREFIAAVHAAQPGTPLLELGSFAKAFPGASRDALDPEAVRALAARAHVDVIVLGEVIEEKASPRISINPEYGTASASAKLTTSLTVRILDGASGATVWSASSRRNISLAGIDLTTLGVRRVGATPAEEARALLMRDLVSDVTFDLRPRWVQR